MTDESRRSQQHLESRFDEFKSTWEDAIGTKGPVFSLTMQNEIDSNTASHIAHCLALPNMAVTPREHEKDHIWALPHPFYDATTERESLRKILVALWKLPSWDTRVKAEVARGSEVGEIVAQVTAKIYRVCRQPKLAFRVAALVFLQLHLEEYFVPPDPFSDEVRPGRTAYDDAQRHSPLRQDATLIWKDLQTRWPEFAVMFSNSKVEGTFLKVTEFWLKTLLLQGLCTSVSDVERKEHERASAEVLHRIVMSAVLSVDSDRDNGLGNPRRELRYLVQCMWWRKQDMLLQCKDRASLLDRLRDLQYYYAMDDGLLELIDARYHDASCPVWPWAGYSALQCCSTSSLGYFCALVPSSLLSIPALSFVGLAAGAFFGMSLARESWSGWVNESIKMHCKGSNQVAAPEAHANRPSAIMPSQGVVSTLEQAAPQEPSRRTYSATHSSTVSATHSSYQTTVGFITTYRFVSPAQASAIPAIPGPNSRHLPPSSRAAISR